MLGLLAAKAAPLFVPGSVLVHEHVLVDFAPVGELSPGRYDANAVFKLALPKLAAIQKLGCVRFQDCTPAYLGRDPRLLRRLADATGVEIWTNTGYYAARQYKHLPPFVRRESAEQIAQRWIEERQRGVDGAQPRFIKIGVNRSPLGALDRKIVRAAAICSRETGLTIASHTGDGTAALEQIEIVTSERVAAGKFVWVHAQSERDHRLHARAALSGAWVEFDGIHPKTMIWHRACLDEMAKRKLLGRVLISQDSGWYHVGEPGGGEFRDYSFIYTDFLPTLPAPWVRALMADNPVRAFSLNS